MLAPQAVESGTTLNDVHSMLNPSTVRRVIRPRDAAELARAVRRAGERGETVSVAGGRHAMGGQQFGQDTLHIDSSGLDRVLSFERQRGLLRIEAGIQWPELIRAYLVAQQGDPEPWAIAQKQTGADRLTVGGAIAANAHGRGLTRPPMIGDVEAVEIVTACGELLRCSRHENPELFSLVVGGYGLFGIVVSVELRLVRRRKLRRDVELRPAEGLAAAFRRRIEAGYLYGDFQFETDERSPTFLTRGVFSCYEPVPDETPVGPDQRELRYEDWVRLLQWAHTDKRRAFEAYSRHYLGSQDQLYWSDTHQLSVYPVGYHGLVDACGGCDVKGSEMITEVYVPRDGIDDFLAAAARELRRAQADVIYGTVRLIEPDAESFLAWARRDWACIVFNLHVDHEPRGIGRAREQFKLLIDLAHERGGCHFLTYHRWATRRQLLRSYPRFAAFLLKKLEYDPEERFQSDWYRHYRGGVS